MPRFRSRVLSGLARWGSILPGNHCAPGSTHFRTTLSPSSHPALIHWIPSCLGSFALWDQKAPRGLAGTCSSCDSPASFSPPIGFRRRSSPKLGQSPRRSQLSKQGARTQLSNLCREDGGSRLLWGCAPRGVPTVPQQVIYIPGRGTRVAHLPQILASWLGFSVSPAFFCCCCWVNPFLTGRKGVFGKRWLPRETLRPLSALHPVGLVGWGSFCCANSGWKPRLLREQRETGASWEHIC